jgi:cytochrome b561
MAQAPPPAPILATPRFTSVAIVLHWLLALMILVSLIVGFTMQGLPVSMLRLKLYNWHKWAGMTILALSLIRLGWRLAHRPPPDVAMPAWQAAAALWNHRLMYLLFVAVPLVGWAYSSASGFPVVWFGLLHLPDFVPVDKELAATIKPWHGRLAYTLATLSLLHVAATLKHQWLDHDGLLDRMRFRSR